MSHSLSDAFELIAIINLPDRTDRRREAEETLRQFGLTPGKGRIEFFPGQRVSTPEGFPSLGARGCFLSHLHLLRMARDRELDSVLIFEDDFEITRSHREALESLVPSIAAAPWEFLYLGHRLDLPPAAQPSLAASDQPIITAHAYAVRASVYAPLIEYLEGCLVRPPGDPVGGPMHFDGALSMFRAAHPERLTLVAQPSLVAQRSSRSDITFRSYEQLPVLKQAMGLARRARNLLRGKDS